MKVPNWLAKWMGGGYASHHHMMSDAFLEDASPSETKSRFFGAPEDTKSFTAPQRLKAPAFMRTNGYLSQWYRADWQYTDLRLKRWAALTIELARARGIPLYVHCAFRTREESDRLFQEKRSKVNWPNSAHNIGEAIDLVHGVFHWEMTPQEWAFVHRIGQEALRRLNASLDKNSKLHLNWGGNDGTKTDTFRWDPAHWEISDYRKRTRRLPPSPTIRETPRAILRQLKL